MSFFCFSQNNSGGGFNHDVSVGIGHYVIIEAADAADANQQAGSLGLYFDGCDEGVDCSCCGDRWYQVDDSDGTSDPQVYSQTVSPGEMAPARDSDSHVMKWFEEGSAEGFIHYLDGRVEPFWENTEARKDLDGSYGYGVGIHRNGVSLYLVTSNGYDPGGNMTPIQGYQRQFTPPAKAKTWTDTDHGYGAGWFPTYEEALKYAESAVKDLQKVSDVIEAATVKNRTVKAISTPRSIKITNYVTDYEYSEKDHQYVDRPQATIEELPA